MRASTSLASMACVLALAAAPPSRALADDEPVMLDVEAAFVAPISEPQLDRFQPGAALSAAVLFAPYSFLLPVLRARGGFFADGARPTDGRLRDPGVGDLFTLTGGVRIRPHGLVQPSDVTRGTTLWVELDIGASITGALVRPTFELALGYAFEAGEVDVGPTLRLLHVLQTEEGLDANSAYVLSLGLEVLIFDRRPAVAEPIDDDEPAAEPEVVEEEPSDRDADGILDASDACADDPEDVDGFADEDGCPDLDDDADQLPDSSDPCPREAEDADGWQDHDGCPEADNDGDRIVDASDACPNQPETINGNDDADGCPDEGLIELVGDRIVLEETVLFALNRARVRSTARAHLEAIVTLWQQHPDWVLVRIEGHADAQGEEDWNLELSQRRAERVVEALVALGMPAAMLTSEGYGSTQPRIDGTSEEAYAANRRVEVVVVERTADGSPAVHAGGTP